MEFLWTLSEWRTPFLDTVFGLVTRLGEETIAIVILCLLYWCVNKKLAYGIGVSYFLSGLFVQSLKISFRIARPWVLDSSFQPVLSAIPAASGYSFPSGHTQSATALFGSLGFYLKKWWARLLCFAAAVLVGFSRMYLGVHTPLDVAVGFALSLLLSFITVRYLVKDTVTKKSAFVLTAALLAIAAGVIVLATALFQGGVIEEHYVADCCKAAGAGIGFAVGMYIERLYIRFETRCKAWWMQAVKFVLGLAGVLLIKEGLKLLIGTGLVVDTLRYCLMLLWMTVLFPLIIQKWFAPKPTAKGGAAQ